MYPFPTAAAHHQGLVPQCMLTAEPCARGVRQSPAAPLQREGRNLLRGKRGQLGLHNGWKSAHGKVPQKEADLPLCLSTVITSSWCPSSESKPVLGGESAGNGLLLGVKESLFVRLILCRRREKMVLGLLEQGGREEVSALCMEAMGFATHPVQLPTGKRCKEPALKKPSKTTA